MNTTGTPPTTPIKPITPAEARVKKRIIPPAVIAVFNSLIEAEFDGDNAVLSQDAVIARILTAVPGVNRQQIFDSHWLDVEGIFEEVGWTVTYEKPGYNEEGMATFTFTAKAMA